MWEQIRANRRRSAVLIVLMTGLLLMTGLIAGAAFGVLELGLVGAAVIFAILMGVYFFAAESVLLAGADAREIKRDDNPRLFNLVEEMKLAAGLESMPRIYLIDDPSPNAFAMGRSADTSVVAVTSGLMHRLDRDELQGVIAHEVAHLKNQDVRFMTLAAVLLGSIVVLSEIVRRSMWLGGRGNRRSNSRGGGGQAQALMMIVALLMAILAPLMAQLLYFACSRKREFLADASAAQFTRYPEGLASALEKIAGARVPVAFASRVNAPMFIVNPLQARGDGASSLFSTHPPTGERIRILRAMTGASLRDYEAAYRQQTRSELIGAQALQSDQPQPARAPSNEGPIATRSQTRQAIYRHHGYISIPCACGLEISVPERYERPDIRCVRCGSVWPIPTVEPGGPPIGKPPVDAAGTVPVPPVLGGPMSYRRTGRGWESFRCVCGRTVQISPAFAAPRVRCQNCRRDIEVVDL